MSFIVALCLSCAVGLQSGIAVHVAGPNIHEHPLCLELDREQATEQDRKASKENSPNQMHTMFLLAIFINLKVIFLVCLLTIIMKKVCS